MSPRRLNWGDGPDPWGDDSPDVVSHTRWRQTSSVALAVITGLLIGVINLAASEKGDSGVAWLGLGTLGLGILIMLARNFSLGIVLFFSVCWIALGTPSIAQGGSGGGSQRLLVSQAGLLTLLALWGLRRATTLRPSPIYRTPVNLGIGLYLFFSAWSTLHSILFPDPLVMEHSYKQFVQVNILEVLMRVLGLVGLLMVATCLERRWLRAAGVALVLPGVLTYTGLLKFIPASFFLAFPQILAMAVLAAFVLTGIGPIWTRLIMAAVALSILFFYFVKGAEWVSGWFGALIALAIITWVANRRLMIAATGVVALIVLLNFSYFYDRIYLMNFYAGGHLQVRSANVGTFENDRSRMMRAALLYAEKFPLGIGLGNYRVYNTYYGRKDVWNTTTFTSAHGTYSQVLTETGWPGLVSFLLLLGGVVRTLWRLYQVLDPGWERSYVLATLGGASGIFAASIMGDYLFPSYHNGGMGSFGACVYIWLFVGFCIAIARNKGLVWKDGRFVPAPLKEPRR
jgi:O-antigen ligase